MEDKIKIELKPIHIPPMVDVNLKELATKINQIIFVLNELGITPAIQNSVSGAVQPQSGQGTGVVSSLADAINKGAQGIMGLFGGAPSAPIPATPGVTTPTRGYTPPDYNQYESSAYEPTTAPAPAAAPAVEPETAAARRLLYGMAQGPYGPLLAYDFVGEA